MNKNNEHSTLKRRGALSLHFSPLLSTSLAVHTIFYLKHSAYSSKNWPELTTEKDGQGWRLLNANYFAPRLTHGNCHRRELAFTILETNCTWRRNLLKLWRRYYLFKLQCLWKTYHFPVGQAYCEDGDTLWGAIACCLDRVSHLNLRYVKNLDKCKILAAQWVTEK